MFGPQSVHAAKGSQARVSTDVLPKVSPSDDASPPASAQSGHPSGSISLADDPELAADIVAAAAAAEAERAAKHAADLAAAAAAEKAKAAKRAADLAGFDGTGGVADLAIPALVAAAASEDVKTATRAADDEAEKAAKAAKDAVDVVAATKTEQAMKLSEAPG